MATLSADKNRVIRADHDRVQQLPVIASDIIYQGAYVGDNASGYMRPLAAADPFRGIAAYNQADNSSGSAGDIRVQLITEGFLEIGTITGASGVGDVGSDVYASDDDTLTLTSTSNSLIGKIIEYRSETSKFIVHFKAQQLRD